MKNENPIDLAVAYARGWTALIVNVDPHLNPYHVIDDQEEWLEWDRGWWDSDKAHPLDENENHPKEQTNGKE
jgi:hypothetical protein